MVESFGGHPSQMFVGVFDGHGPYGRAAAKHASAAMPAAIARAGPLAGLSDRRWAKLLRDACAEVNLSMQDPMRRWAAAAWCSLVCCLTLLAAEHACGRICALPAALFRSRAHPSAWCHPPTTLHMMSNVQRL